MLTSALFTAKCYMWATEDGKLPPANEPASSSNMEPAGDKKTTQLSPGQELDLPVCPFSPHTIIRDGDLVSLLGCVILHFCFHMLLS